MIPQLSILIPSIPSRLEKAQALYRHILSLVEHRHIEVLMLCDNKKRSIGEKRNALKDMAQGKYFMFVDDDDTLLSVAEIYDATFGDVDVITFKQRCLNGDKTSFVVTFGLGNPVEHRTDEVGRYLDCRRPPFHVCAWADRFKVYDFGPINYAEDWVFVQEANGAAQTETHIDKIIHAYNYDPLLSEAPAPDTPAPAPAPAPPVVRGPGPRRAVVNLVTDVQRYYQGQQRLRESLYDFRPPDVALTFFTTEAQVRAPRHAENPYAFKVYAVEALRAQGYDQVLWLDASTVAVKNIEPVFEWLDQKGLFMEASGHFVGDWCNQAALDYFALSREEAMTMPMYSAGFSGFDFRRPEAVEFFERWRASMLAGCFKGSWADHRHDMSCGSILANQMGLADRYSPVGQFFAYVGPGYPPPQPSAVFEVRGL